MTALDLDPRYPTPAMSHWHAQRLLRRASWQRLALPATAKVVAVGPQQPIVAPQPVDLQAEQFRTAFDSSLHARGIIRFSTVVRVVAAKYRIAPDDIVGRGRRLCFGRPRMIAMYVAWLSGHSLVQIGKCFHRRHATVLHAVRSVRRQVALFPNIAADVGALFVACGGCES
jgi:Bacterial dnaA protein helix-turn-helix